MVEDTFGYEPPKAGFNLSLLKESEAYRLLRVEYRSPLKTPYPGNNKAYALHYLPKHRRKMLAIVVLHGLGVETLQSERLAGENPKRDKERQLLFQSRQGEEFQCFQTGDYGFEMS